MCKKMMGLYEWSKYSLKDALCNISPVKNGDQVFQFLDLHNFCVQYQYLLEIVDLVSTYRDLSIDMLHDTVFPHDYKCSFRRKNLIQQCSHFSSFQY